MRLSTLVLLIAVATWSGCGGGAATLPPLSRYATSVEQVQRQLEARIDSLAYPEGIWSISSDFKRAGQTLSNPDFSQVIVVRDPLNPRTFIELQLEDTSPNPMETATFSALAEKGVFRSQQWYIEDRTVSSFRFEAESWNRLVGSRSDMYDYGPVQSILTYDRMWPLTPSDHDQEYFADAPEGIVEAGPPEERPGIRGGSGFILPSRMLAATNYHVIEGASSIEIWSSSDGEWHPSEIVRSDPANDLALLEVPEEARPPSSTPTYGVRSSTEIRIGSEVHAIGFPLTDVLGSRSRFTTGTVSADVGIRDDPRVVQTTAPIQSGNSGGPLVDAFGQVIGVVVATLNSSLFLERTGSVPQNVNFAIKIDYLRLLAGDDFGVPGDRPSLALQGSDIAERMTPWVVRIRAIRN